MKHSTLIQRAKKYLAHSGADWVKDHKTFYVCNAITQAGIFYDESKKATDITDLIDNRLKHCATVFDWLWEVLPASDEKDYIYDDDVLQDYRLRWMDSLINEYKEAGK